MRRYKVGLSGVEKMMKSFLHFEMEKEEEEETQQVGSNKVYSPAGSSRSRKVWEEGALGGVG